MSRMIPKNWTSISLANTGDLVMGQSPSGSSYNNAGNGLPLLNGAAELRIDRIDVKKFTTSPTRKSEPGDLLFCIRATIGNLNVSDKEYCLGRGVAALRVNDKYSKKYVGLQLEALFDQMRKMSQGGVIKGLKKEEIGDFEFPIPVDKAEQEKIADIIISVEKAIQQTQKMTEQSEKLKKSLMKQLFTRGIGHTKFNETEIGEVPESWKIGSFSDLVNSSDKNAIKPGPFGSSLKKQYYVPAGYKIYGQEQVISGNPYYGDYYVNEDKYKELIAFKVRAGDVLISLVGTIGKILIVPEDFEPGIINPRLLKITPDKSKSSSHFMAYILGSESVLSQMNQKSHGGTMNILNKGMLVNMRFGIPPLKEQHKIVEILQSIDKQIKVNRKLRAKQEQLKQGLMQDLLTGKVAP